MSTNPTSATEQQQPHSEDVNPLAIAEPVLTPEGWVCPPLVQPPHILKPVPNRRLP
jgi:hypothetical protein